MVRRSVATIVFPVLLAAVMAAQTAIQTTPSKGDAFARNCHGLHAGIRAQIIPPYTETPSVMLTFLLLNDSETPLDVDSGSWRIVINGSELNDSGMIFGNGLGVVGGYKVLKPGETYDLAKSSPSRNISFQMANTR